MKAFEFLRPKTLEEARAALAADEAEILAGGQTLIATMKQGLAAPERLVSLAAIEGLGGISREGDALTIGATATHARVAREAADAFPALAALAGQIGDPAVRNRGTIGGALANNDPSADYPAAALACGATIRTDRRAIAAEDFFLGLFETALDEGEIITAVSFPIPEAAHYEKFRQPASGFALAGVFLARFADGAVRLAVTGASEAGVFRWGAAEAALSEAFAPAALEGLALPSEGMIGDIHGTPAYRAHLAAVLARRAVKACAQAPAAGG